MPTLMIVDSRMVLVHLKMIKYMFDIDDSIGPDAVYRALPNVQMNHSIFNLNNKNIKKKIICKILNN